MTNLQIPYAYTNNKLPVSPQVAEKGQNFSCPICDSEVILKRGNIRAPHFAHKPATACSGEGVRPQSRKTDDLSYVSENCSHCNGECYNVPKMSKLLARCSFFPNTSV